jgi:hypothetical protein
VRELAPALRFAPFPRRAHKICTGQTKRRPAAALQRLRPTLVLPPVPAVTDRRYRSSPFAICLLPSAFCPLLFYAGKFIRRRRSWKRGAERRGSSGGSIFKKGISLSRTL